MKRVLVRYKVKPEKSDENRKAVERVYDQLRERKPAGLQYATLVMDDGVTFYHLAAVDTPDGNTPLSDLPAFKAFQAGLKERCVEMPDPREVTLVGSYRVFGD